MNLVGDMVGLYFILLVSSMYVMYEFQKTLGDVGYMVRG